MVDLKMTEQLYSKQGLVYNKKPHEIGYENWYNSVTNRHKRDKPGHPEPFYYYQIQELRSAGLVPEDFGEDRKDRFDSNKLKTYPEKIVISIARVQDPNGNEWLKSKQMWIGMDRLGNEIPQSVGDPETYEDPQFRYEYKHKDPMNPLSPTERKAIPGINSVRRFTMPFTEENLEQLLAMRPSKDLHSVNFAVLRIGTNGQTLGAVYGVKSLDDFRSRPFDELYDWLSAVISKTDTKMGREQEKRDKDKDNRHYR